MTIDLAVAALASQVGGGGGLTYSYESSAESGNNASGYTFSSMGIGTADSDRRVIVVAATRGTNTVSSVTVTVGGVSASIDYLSGHTGTGNSIVFASAAVPTGTAADVVVTWSGSMLRCGVAVYRFIGAVAVSDSDVASTDPATINLTSTVDGGVCLGAEVVVGKAHTATWSGGMTEDVYLGIEGNSVTASYASGAIGGTTFNPSVSTDDALAKFAAVAYEPA